MGHISALQTCRLCGFGVQITRCPQHMAGGHWVACPCPAAGLALQCPAECMLPLLPSAPQTLPGHLLGICPQALSLPSPCAAMLGFHQDNGDAPRSLSPIQGATASPPGDHCHQPTHNNSKWHLFTKNKRRKPSSILWLLPQGAQPCISVTHSSYQLHQGVREEEGASLWAGESLGRHVKLTSSRRRQ